jgi:hypothetical protein
MCPVDMYMSRAAFRGRECVVYLPSAEDLKIWKEEAEGHGTSLSKYIFEMAQRGRRSSIGTVSVDRSDERDDRSDLIAENEALRERLRNTSLMIEKMQHDLAELNTQNDSTYYYVPALISLFRKTNILSNEKIISWLNLKADDDELGDIFRTLNKLNEWHLIDTNARGDWRWIR